MKNIEPDRQKVRVRCTYEIDIEVPADWDREMITFYVEEDGCPGTSAMGGVLDRLMEECDENHTCWACASKGKCEALFLCSDCQKLSDEGFHITCHAS